MYIVIVLSFITEGKYLVIKDWGEFFWNLQKLSWNQFLRSKKQEINKRLQCLDGKTLNNILFSNYFPESMKIRTFQIHQFLYVHNSPGAGRTKSVWKKISNDNLFLSPKSQKAFFKGTYLVFWLNNTVRFSSSDICSSKRLIWKKIEIF